MTDKCRGAHYTHEQCLAAGARIAAWRQDHGTRRGARRVAMTQAEFAKSAGVSVGAIQGLENGTRIAHHRTLQKIASTMHTTVEKLMAEPPNEKPTFLIDANVLEQPLSPEAILVARAFAAAGVNAGVAVIRVLQTALQNRTDSVGIALSILLSAALPATAGGIQPTATADPSAGGVGTGPIFPASVASGQ